VVPPSDALRRALAPLLDAPEETAIVTDFDGTLAPIVDDPGAAQPLAGAAAVLAALAARYGVVAVVSGRPVDYLRAHLDLPPAPGGSGDAPAAPLLVGLYGFERAGPDGRVTLDESVERWLPTVAEVTARLTATAPAGVLVEAKGATVTLHWRRAPDAVGWARAAVAEETARSSLRAFPGRMSVELRPPLDVDKGSVVAELVQGRRAVCYFGDDLGDLPAFAALADAGRREGVTALSIAVVDDETPVEVVRAADVRVPGPEAALGALAWLAEKAGAAEERTPDGDGPA
jgi:trehalose 6-phosphate phosphatase